jgi:glycosyltransferase involved in cell wall biosynthesis
MALLSGSQEMPNLFIVPIEKIETRYTKHWFDFLPTQISKYTNFNVKQICLPSGDDAPVNSEGGFFNFGFTCSYKSKQLIVIEQLFDKEVKPGDVFLFTDYWNPAVAFLRYISAMKGVPITIVGICHAGLWDPEDMLTKAFGKKDWGQRIEHMLAASYDHLVFATQFSRSLFIRKEYTSVSKSRVTGFPMEYYDTLLKNYWDLDNAPLKENTVVFPHRKAQEKKIDLFLEIEKVVTQKRPDIKFKVALDHCKNKDEYHDLLYSSKVTFSAATQETLGISMGIESLICGCVPLVPNRLSYAELFEKTPEFFIDDDKPVEVLAERVVEVVDGYDSYVKSIKLQRELARNWFDGYKFYSFLNSL